MEAKINLQLSEDEMKDYIAYKADLERKRQAEQARSMRETYRKMVDDEIDSAIPELLEVSNDIRTVKKALLDNFKAIISMKADMFRLSKGIEMDNRSHTFTNSAGNKRITIGVYVTDGYLDTAEEGIAMIYSYISSLATDEKSQALVDMVLKLLAKDSKGTLKASRIIQLRRIAEKSGNDTFLDGVKIIEDAFSPAVSRTYVRAEYKDDNGIWKNIPLGMTES